MNLESFLSLAQQEIQSNQSVIDTMYWEEFDPLVVDSATTENLMNIFSISIFVVSIVGALASIINMAVFVKQGLNDTVNISLFVLTLSELSSLLLLIWFVVLVEPTYFKTDMWFVGIEVQFLTAGWPHALFARFNGWVTAYIMVERCLCVALPLKVKLIVSKEKTITCLVVMFIIILATVIPTYATSSIQWRFYPEYNSSLLGLVYADNYFDATAVPNIINNPILSVASFTIVLICTSIIIRNLNKKSKWRQSTSAKQPGSQPSNLTSKDKRATKMVTIISVMLLVSVTPSVLTDFIASVDAEFCLTGKHRNMFYLFYCVTFAFETVNSSLSIVVYYNMNSRFRETYRRLFHAGCQVKSAGSNVEVQGHSEIKATNSNLPSRRN